MREAEKPDSSLTPSLTPEAQNRLNEAIRTGTLEGGELEPVVLNQLATYPEEVQKNVIDRFLTTGLAEEVQNKTGWLVGILKRELKAYQEAVRFRGLDPSVSKKLESALRTKRLRPDEFPSDIITILSKCSLHEQQIVVDKFLQRYNQSAQHGGKGSYSKGPSAPYVSARSSLNEIIRAELGSQHLQAYQTLQTQDAPASAYGTGRREYYPKDSSRDAYRANLQKTLRLHEDVIQMLLNIGDQELYEKLTSVGSLPPNYVDSEKIWSLLGETSVDEQLRVVREMIAVHRDDIPENEMTRFGVEKRREEFRVAVEKVMMSYGFYGFGGRSQVPEMRGKISVSEDGVTTCNFSELTLSNEEWKQEFSPVTKRKLKYFMRGRSPALVLDFHGSRVGEKIGRVLLDFFAQQKPNIDVSLVTLNLTDADLQTDDGWNDIASFLLTTPARELELSTSKISSLSLGILVHTMFDGEFPPCAPFFMLQDVNPPKLAISLPNNTWIRFPPSNEPWVKQWLVAGQLLIDNDTFVEVQHIYHHLRHRGTNPAQWFETPQWNSPIHPARVDILYSKLRQQGYLPPKEEDPKMHKGYGAYYDPRYDYTYDSFGYGKWGQARNGFRRGRNGSIPDIYEMGGKGVYGDFRRDGYPMQPSARSLAPVVVDARDEHEKATMLAAAAGPPREKKSRNKMPKQFVDQELNEA